MSDAYMDDDGYVRLANTIVVIAAKDYRSVLRRLRRRSTEAAREEAGELEEFFRSEWYQALTSVDGDELMTMLRKEAEHDG